MPVTLYVDGPRWRDHLRGVVVDHPGLVPVAKGNGYGFGIGSLARRAQWLGVDTVAVGTYAEVAEVEKRFDGDILVLEPWRPFLADAVYGPRILHTVGRLADLTAVGRRDDRPRVLLEALTSIGRHGFATADMTTAMQSAQGVRIEGHALHLPLGNGHLAEIERWLEQAPAKQWFVSHVGASEIDALRGHHPGVEFRPRIGTDLWLGDRGALTVRATVLDCHPVTAGDRVGYRQRRIPRAGVVVVVSGGTAHGIGLEAPAPAVSARQRMTSLARGGLDAAGRALSPYIIDGHRRWFVEPPHMQVSMLFVPDTAQAPSPGDEVVVHVRHTTTLVDHVVIS